MHRLYMHIYRERCARTRSTGGLATRTDEQRPVYADASFVLVRICTPAVGCDMIAHVECFGEYLLDNQNEGERMTDTMHAVWAGAHYFVSTPLTFGWLFACSLP